MKFLLDENVSPLIDGMLTSLGHTILRCPPKTSDNELIGIARKEEGVIVTHDKDFMAVPTSGLKGILLIRIHPPWEKDVASALKKFMSLTKPDSWKGKLVLLEADGFLIRS